MHRSEPCLVRDARIEWAGPALACAVGSSCRSTDAHPRRTKVSLQLGVSRGKAQSSTNAAGAPLHFADKPVDVGSTVLVSGNSSLTTLQYGASEIVTREKRELDVEPSFTERPATQVFSFSKPVLHRAFVYF
jgi:hypothetical protein